MLREKIQFLLLQKFYEILNKVVSQLLSRVIHNKKVAALNQKSSFIFTMQFVAKSGSGSRQKDRNRIKRKKNGSGDDPFLDWTISQNQIVGILALIKYFFVFGKKFGFNTNTYVQ